MLALVLVGAGKSPTTRSSSGWSSRCARTFCVYVRFSSKLWTFRQKGSSDVPVCSIASPKTFLFRFALHDTFVESGNLHAPLKSEGSLVSEASGPARLSFTPFTPR